MLVLTIIAWSYCIDTLDYYFPRLHLASHTSVRLIRNGKLLKDNMHRQKISEEELMSHIRRCGLEEVTEIKSAYIEGDGHISVIMQSQMTVGKETRNPAK